MSKRILRQALAIEEEYRRLANQPPSALAICGDESIGPSISQALTAPSKTANPPMTIHLAGVAQDQYDRAAQSSAAIILDAIIERHASQPDVTKEFAELRELIFAHGWQPRTERLFRLALADPRVQPEHGVALLSSRPAQALSDKATHDVGMMTLEAWKRGCFGFVDAPPIEGWGARATTNKLHLKNKGVRREVMKYFSGYNDVEKPALRLDHLEAWTRLLEALDETAASQSSVTASACATVRAREMCRVLLHESNPSGSEIRLVQKRALLAACMVEGTAFGVPPTLVEQMADHLQSLTLGYVDARYNEQPFENQLDEFVNRHPKFVPPFSLLAEAVDFVKKTQLLLDRVAQPFIVAPVRPRFATLESDALRRLAEHLRATIAAVQFPSDGYRALPPGAFFDAAQLDTDDYNDVAERCGWLADLHIRDEALCNQYRAEAALVAQMGARHAATPEALHRAERLRWMFDPARVEDNARALVDGSGIQLPGDILGEEKSTLAKLRRAHAGARWRTVEIRRRWTEVVMRTKEESSSSELTALAAKQCELIREEFQRIYDEEIDRGAQSLALMSAGMAWLWTLQGLCAVNAVDDDTWRVAESNRVIDILHTMELALMLASWLQVRQWLPNVRLPEIRDKAQIFVSYKRVPSNDSLADQFKAKLVGANGKSHAGIRVLMDTDQDVQHELEWLKRLFIEQFSADATVCFVSSRYAASPWCALEARIAGLRVRLDAGKYQLYILRTEPLDFTDSNGDVQIWNMPKPLDKLSTFAELDGTWHEATMVALTKKLEEHCAFARATLVDPSKPRGKLKAAEA